MKDITYFSVLASALFLLSLFLLWLVRREYRLLGKISAKGSIVHFLVFAPHAYLSHDILMSGGTAYTFSDLEMLATVGSLAAFFGLIIMLMGMGIFRSFSRILGNDASALKTSGIYRFTRNPQYIGYGIFFLGIYLIWWNRMLLIGVFFYCLLVYCVVRVEEEHLSRVFGSAYLNYCKQIPRFFGIPRRGGFSQDSSGETKYDG